MKSTGRLAVLSLIYIESAEISTKREPSGKKIPNRTETESSKLVRRTGNIVCLENTTTWVALANGQENAQVQGSLHPPTGARWGVYWSAVICFVFLLSSLEEFPFRIPWWEEEKGSEVLSWHFWDKAFVLKAGQDPQYFRMATLSDYRYCTWKHWEQFHNSRFNRYSLKREKSKKH